MIAGIMTIPERKDMLDNLIKKVSNKVRNLIIFCDDEHKGYEFNIKRMIKYMTDIAEIDEEVLLMTDDVDTVDDWKEYFYNLKNKVEKETGEKPQIYVFMARQRHLLKYKDVGYFYGIQRRGFYDHAFILINQKGIIDRVDDWFKNGGFEKISQKRRNHYDIVIQDYLVNTGQKFVITVPTLFNHIGKISSLKHIIGVSVCYLGDVRNEGGIKNG